MSVLSVFSRRVRGFRIVEVLGAALLIATVLTVYLGKTFAGKERSQIADVEQQIAQEKDRVRMLQAEVAYLEQPARLERLSSQVLRLAPIDPKHETTLEGLPALAAAPAAKLPTAEPQPMLAQAEAAPAAPPATPAQVTPAAAKAVKVGAPNARGGLTP